MNRKRAFFAAGVGLLSAALSFAFLYQKTSELSQRTTPVKVLVASRYLPAGVTLKEDMVASKEIPKSYVGPSAISDVNDVSGFRSLAPISSGEQILSNKFGLSDPLLSSALTPGKRAFTMDVDEKSSLGGLLRPGDHVDVLAKANRGGRELTMVAFQNLEVLAVGHDLGRSQKDDPDKEADHQGTITLLVTAEQSEELFYLDGKALRLTLRTQEDNEIISYPILSEEDLLSRLGKFPSAKKDAGPIKVIKNAENNGGEE